MPVHINHKRSCKGFTLIELLVVIAIIAILSVIGVTVFSGVQKSARDAKRRTDLHAISLALEEYKSVSGTYPKIGDGWDIGATYPGGATDWATLQTLLAPYISGGILPVDPTNVGRGYLYYDSNVPAGGARGAGYTLIAYPMESNNNIGCGFYYFDANYPGRYICERNQQ